VLQGDSLRSIAAEYGLSPQDIAAANDLRLIPVQLLHVPPPSSRQR